jgi:type VI secretion system protein ImpL
VLKFLRRRVFVVMVGLLLVALVIWVAGPLLAFADWYPLAPALNRVIAIALIIGAWALAAWLKKRKAARAGDQLAAAVVQQSQAEARPSADVVQLRERFAEAVAALKQQKRGRQSLYDLPWYVIIGAPGSGKTTALVNSGLHFPLEQRTGKGALRGVGGTRNCDWWFTEEAVFLDTAGRYTTQDSDASADSAGWAEFLSLLVKYRKRRPINGVLVAISAQDLMVQGQAGREAHVAATRRRLTELNKDLRIQLPVYVLVTKCDLVAGFTEYFDDVAQEGRTQVWGVTFPYEQTQKGTAGASYAAEFDALVQRLNERVLSRLEGERDVRRRAHIFGFPQQMAALREPLTAFVEELFAPTRFEAQTLLRGVYFTSGTQEGTPIDRLLGALGRRFAVAPEAVAPGRGKAYFIERLLKEVMLAESGLAGVNRRLEVRKAAAQAAAYIGMAAVAVLGIIGLTTSYRSNRTYLDAVAADVAALQQAPPRQSAGSLEALLPRLDALRAVVRSADRHRDDVPWRMRWGLYQGEAIGDAARDAYSRELDDTLLPQIAARIRQRLIDFSPEIDVLYLYLKGYLMLGYPEHFQRDHLKYLADVEWRTAYRHDPDAGARLSEHFTSLLDYNERLPPVALDDALVEQARRAIPPDAIPRLIYGRLKLTYAADTAGQIRFDTILNATQVFQRRSGTSLAQPVSSLYTKKVFTDVVAKGTDQLQQEFEADRWVWGDAFRPSPIASSQLRATVIDLYEKDYIATWDGVLTDLGLRPLGNLENMKRTLQILSGTTSPLREILKVVAANTLLIESASGEQSRGTIASGLEALDRLVAGARETAGLAVVTPGEQVTRYFAPIHALVAGEAGRTQIDGVLAEIQQLLDKLQAVGTGIGQETGNPATLAAVGQSAEQLKQNATGLPKPVGDLVAEVGTSAQMASRSGLRTSLFDRYRQDVVQYCQQVVTNRYPFTAQSSVDVPIDDFGALFGYAGVFDTFFAQNLVDLVDTAPSVWRWRADASGATVGLSDGVLRQFQQAKTIREMFFAPTSGKPEVPFNITVQRLHPPTVLRMRLEMDGVSISYAHGPLRPEKFSWPGESPRGAAVTFEERTGVPQSIATTGPWAWFRLVEQGRPRQISAERYELTFEKAGRSTTVTLDASSVRNPFGRLNVLRQFRCGV